MKRLINIAMWILACSEFAVAQGVPLVSGNDADKYAGHELEIFCNSLVKNQCYSVIIVPSISGRPSAPFSDGKMKAEGKRFGVIEQEDVADLIELMAKDPVYVGVPPIAVESLDAYFLMENAKTSGNYKMRIRLMPNVAIIDLIDKNKREISIRTSDQFFAFLKKHLVACASDGKK